MTRLESNRDLYQAIEKLTEQNAASERSLEQYLHALLSLAQEHRREPEVSLDEFYAMLRDAFTTDPPDFDAIKTVEPVDENAAAPGYNDWLKTIVYQVIDLHEMRKSGLLESPDRHFGLQSQLGAWWCNFDPAPFLECAAAGSMGGWEPGDATGRDFVPGPVILLDENNQVVEKMPDEIPRPVFKIAGVSWKQFQDFLQCGQQYE